jgi:hypothetical protein
VQAEGILLLVELVAPKRNDAGDLLAVEEHEAARHPVGHLEAVVVEQPPHDLETGIVVHGQALVAAAAPDDEAAAKFSPHCPVDEVGHLGR